MASNIVKLLRSITPGSRPSGQQYGTPYFNFGDNQFGGFDSSNVARDLVGVPMFSAAKTYGAGNAVNNGGQLYVANGAIPAGAFNPAQWIPVNPAANYNFGGWVNKFRNPKFEFWTRGAVTAPAGGGALTADGWYVSPTGVALPVSSATPPAGINCTYSLYIKGVAGLTAVSVYQFMESFATEGLASQVCTASLSFYNGTGAAVTPTVNVGYPNTTDSWGGGLTNFVTNANFQSCPPSAWTRIGYTFNVPANVLQGMYVSFNFPGVTNPANSYYVVQADVRPTPGLPVGICYNPPPFEDRPAGVEWLYVRRYYQVGSTLDIWAGYMTASATCYSRSIFIPPMRTTPSVVLQDVSDNGFATGPPIANVINYAGVQLYKTAPVVGFGWYGWGFTASCEF